MVCLPDDFAFQVNVSGNGKFLDISGAGTAIYAKSRSCRGGAVLVMQDRNGGVLTGLDKVYIGSAGWATNSSSGYIAHTFVGYQGGTENFTLHRIDSKKTPHRFWRQGRAQRLYGEMGLR